MFCKMYQLYACQQLSPLHRVSYSMVLVKFSTMVMLCWIPQVHIPGQHGRHSSKSWTADCWFNWAYNLPTCLHSQELLFGAFRSYLICPHYQADFINLFLCKRPVHSIFYISSVYFVQVKCTVRRNRHTGKHLVLHLIGRRMHRKWLETTSNKMFNQWS